MSVEVVGKIVPKNNNKFFLMDADKVEYEGKALTLTIPIPVTQARYNELVTSGSIDEDRIYIIVETEI